jgi:putative ATP-dependent endonuclease of OLD family
LYIHRIGISNFRNFKSVVIEDLPPGVVVVGENASGKSNLLHALSLVLDPSLPETARQLVADDFWDGLEEPFAGAEIRVEVDLVGFDDDDDAKAVLGEFLVGRAPYRARLTYLYRPRGDRDPNVSTTETDYEALVFGGEDEGRRVGRAEWRFVSLRVLPALRDAEGDLRSARSPLRRLVSRAAVPQEVLDGVSDAIDHATGTLLAQEALQRLEDALSQRLYRMVGDLFAVDATLGIVSARSDQLLRSLKLFIDAERGRGIAQASLGTANLLYLVLLLEDIAAQRANNELVELILAVEEPEAHLHPHVQRVLFRHLLREDRALLVTTHSPHIASVAPLRSLLLLRDIGGESAAFDVRDVGLSELQERDLERYLDVTRAEILFARIVILVEGVAELYLVPAFAGAAGLDLDAHAVTVCSVHGTDFLPYRRLLGQRGLDIPTVVITDGDPNAEGLPVGLRRAGHLLRQATGERVRSLTDAADYSAGRELCATENVFVGDRTLELDLLPAAQAAMYAAYQELVTGPVAREKFSEALAAAPDDSTSADEVLNRIERLGKGRYAQRVAEHLAGVEPPEYIAVALGAVQELIGSEASRT